MISMRKASKILVCLFIMVFAVSGCGGAKKGPEGDARSQTKQVVNMNLSAEPETIDPGRAKGQPDLTVVNAIMEGLTRYNLKCELEPAMAERWEISDDGRTYKFFIRKDARWSNGDPVTAYDFEYAWKRVLDPEYASSYAYQLYYIENAYEYNDPDNLEVTSPDMVGVKAIDASTLEVTLAVPALHFLGLTAFPTYFPVHKATVEDNPSWDILADTYINNGPFKLVRWEPFQKIVCVKNEAYWDREQVNLDELIFSIVSEESTALALYERNDFDIVYNIPSQELERLKAAPDSGLKIADELAVALYIFNITKEPFDDVRVRKALAAALDRQALADYVTRGGERPAYAYVPYGLPDVNPWDDFRKMGGDYFAESIEEARFWLSEAGYPDGKGFPEVELLINESQDNLRMAQAVQEMWKQNLGIQSVTIRPLEWRMYLGTIFTMEHQIAGAGWGADYLDPMAFLDVYVSFGGNNVSGFKNETYDELIALANSTSDPQVRIGAMHQAEQILMDEMPILPLIFYTKPYLMKDHVKNVRVPSFGPQMEFKWAYIDR